MSIARRRGCVFTLSLTAALALSLGALAEAQQYKQTNLVSDLPGAMFPDSNLVNPWGLSRSSTSPIADTSSCRCVPSAQSSKKRCPSSLKAFHVSGLSSPFPPSKSSSTQ